MQVLGNMVLLRGRDCDRMSFGVQSPTARRSVGISNLQAVGASTEILDVVTCSGYLQRGSVELWVGHGGGGWQTGKPTARRQWSPCVR